MNRLMSPINLLRVRPRTKSKIDCPPDPGRNRPNTHEYRWKMAVRSLTREPPGERGAKNNIKTGFKYGWGRTGALGGP